METDFSSCSSSSYNSSVLLMWRLFVDLLPPLHVQKHQLWLGLKLWLTLLRLLAPRTSQVCHPLHSIPNCIGSLRG